MVEVEAFVLGVCEGGCEDYRGLGIAASGFGGRGGGNSEVTTTWFSQI